MISFFTRGESLVASGDPWAQQNIPWTRRRIIRKISPAFEKLKEGRAALERRSARGILTSDFQRASRGKETNPQYDLFEKAQARLKARSEAREKSQAVSAKSIHRPKPLNQIPLPTKAKIAITNLTPSKSATQTKPATQQNIGAGKKR